MKGGTQRRGTKLSKGQITQLKQQKASLFTKIKNFVDKNARVYEPKKLRLNWIQQMRFSSKHTPHQGHQECARRVRQLESGFIKQ